MAWVGLSAGNIAEVKLEWLSELLLCIVLQVMANLDVCQSHQGKYIAVKKLLTIFYLWDGPNGLYWIIQPTRSHRVRHMDYKREAIVGLRLLSTSSPSLTHIYWISYLNSTSLGWVWVKKYSIIYFFKNFFFECEIVSSGMPDSKDFIEKYKISWVLISHSERLNNNIWDDKGSLRTNYT